MRNPSVVETTVKEPEATVSEATVSKTKDAVIEPTFNITTDEKVSMEAEEAATENNVNTSINEVALIAGDSTVNKVAVTTGDADGNENVPMKVEATFNQELPLETEVTVNEEIPMAIEDATIKQTPLETECVVEPAVTTEAILNEIEDIVTAIVKNSKVLNKIIQGLKGSQRITEVGINYKNEKVVSYKLFHPRIEGHEDHTDFGNDFKNQRSEDARSIYFFELKKDD
ncbi:hypothetical protein ACET3Z_004836 [Daucus carota]